jgi:hypothetical protein
VISTRPVLETRSVESRGEGNPVLGEGELTWTLQLVGFSGRYSQKSPGGLIVYKIRAEIAFVAY